MNNTPSTKRRLSAARPPLSVGFPLAWLFFIFFILVATFTMLNLFIAIIVNAMQDVQEEEQSVGGAADKLSAFSDKDIHAELGALREEIRLLRTALARNKESQ